MDIEKAIDNEYTETANLGCVEISEQMKPYIIELLKLRKEVEQYHKIGTFEECRTAREKMIPKEPLICGTLKQELNGDTIHTSAVSYQDDCYECPSCGSFLGYVTDCKDEKYQDNFCSACGQALKWGD